MIDALPVEFDEIFERAEVGRIVTGGSGIFDVMKGEFVLSCGCHSCSCCGSGALETAIAVSARVLLPTVRLDEALVEAFDKLLEDRRLEVKLCKRFSESGKR